MAKTPKTEAEIIQKKQTRIRDINEWQKEKLDRIAFTVPKGERAKIKEIAKRKGYSSTNAYLYDLVKKDMQE